MSDFLKDPKFQPDENFKNFIDSIFEEKPKKAEGKKVNFELQLPDPPELTEEEIKLALKIARDEMEIFKTKFLEMQDEVSDLAIFAFLHPNLEDFGETCSDLVDLIENNFSEEKMSQIGKDEYPELLKLRKHILASVYRKYTKDNE